MKRAASLDFAIARIGALGVISALLIGASALPARADVEVDAFPVPAARPEAAAQAIFLPNQIAAFQGVVINGIDVENLLSGLNKPGAATPDIRSYMDSLASRNDSIPPFIMEHASPSSSAQNPDSQRFGRVVHGLVQKAVEMRRLSYRMQQAERQAQASGEEAYKTQLKQLLSRITPFGNLLDEERQAAVNAAENRVRNYNAAMAEGRVSDAARLWAVAGDGAGEIAAEPESDPILIPTSEEFRFGRVAATAASHIFDRFFADLEDSDYQPMSRAAAAQAARGAIDFMRDLAARNNQYPMAKWDFQDGFIRFFISSPEAVLSPEDITRLRQEFSPEKPLGRDFRAGGGKLFYGPENSSQGTAFLQIKVPRYYTQFSEPPALALEPAQPADSRPKAAAQKSEPPPPSLKILSFDSAAHPSAGKNSVFVSARSGTDVRPVIIGVLRAMGENAPILVPRRASDYGASIIMASAEKAAEAAARLAANEGVDLVWVHPEVLETIVSGTKKYESAAPNASSAEPPANILASPSTPNVEKIIVKKMRLVDAYPPASGTSINPLVAYVDFTSSDRADIEPILAPYVRDGRLVEQITANQDNRRVVFSDLAIAARAALELVQNSSVKRIYASREVVAAMREFAANAARSAPAPDFSGLSGSGLRDFLLKLFDQGHARGVSVRYSAAELFATAASNTDVQWARDILSSGEKMASASRRYYPEISAAALILGKYGNNTSDRRLVEAVVAASGAANFGGDRYNPFKEILARALALSLKPENDGQLSELRGMYEEKAHQNYVSQAALSDGLYLALSRYGSGSRDEQWLRSDWKRDNNSLARTKALYEYLKKNHPEYLQALAEQFKQSALDGDRGANAAISPEAGVLPIFSAGLSASRRDSSASQRDLALALYAVGDKEFVSGESAPEVAGQLMRLIRGDGGVIADNEVFFSDLAGEALGRLLARYGNSNAEIYGPIHRLLAKWLRGGFENKPRTLMAAIKASALAALDEDSERRMMNLMESRGSTDWSDYLVGYHEMTQQEASLAWARMAVGSGRIGRYLESNEKDGDGRPISIIERMLIDQNPFVNKAALEALRLYLEIGRAAQSGQDYSHPPLS